MCPEIKTSGNTRNVGSIENHTHMIGDISSLYLDHTASLKTSTADLSSTNNGA